MGAILLYKVSAPVQAAAAEAEATDQNQTRPYLFRLGAVYIFRQEGIKMLENAGQNGVKRDILRVAGDRLVCPICGRPTQQRVLPTTRLIAFPLFCKHCRLTTVAEYAPEPESQSH